MARGAAVIDPHEAESCALCLRQKIARLMLVPLREALDGFLDFSRCRSLWGRRGSG